MSEHTPESIRALARRYALYNPQVLAALELLAVMLETEPEKLSDKRSDGYSDGYEDGYEDGCRSYEP